MEKTSATPDLAEGGWYASRLFIARLFLKAFVYILFAVLSINLTACSATAEKDIWIGHRQDGLRGSGRQHDPYDGSTAQKFDSILNRYWWNGVEGLTVNILPGVYETKGNADYQPHVPGLGAEGWRCRSGWHIKGAGQNKTILKLTKVYPMEKGSFIIGISTHDSFVENVTVQDLTIDCNHTAIGNATSTEEGISLLGSGHTIRRVTVQNLAGFGYECFGIQICSNNRNSQNNLIEECTVKDWKGGAGGTIVVSNNVNNLQPPFTYTSGVIRNNHVHGTQIAYGGWGMRNVIFEDNTSKNCDYGVNVDSVDNRSVSFIGNQLTSCGNYGMVFAQCHNFTISRNKFTSFKGLHLFTFLSHASNFTISANTITAKNPSIIFAEGRDTTSLAGTITFAKNHLNFPQVINLPSNLVRKHK